MILGVEATVHDLDVEATVHDLGLDTETQKLGGKEKRLQAFRDTGVEELNKTSSLGFTEI